MEKVYLFDISPAKSIFEKCKKKQIENNVQSGMIKCFVNCFSADNFQDGEVIWSQETFQNQ